MGITVLIGGTGSFFCCHGAGRGATILTISPGTGPENGAGSSAGVVDGRSPPVVIPIAPCASVLAPESSRNRRHRPRPPG
ncbi:hypothetical protein [Methanoculleus sp. 10]|uniref:hypothetical protein n=1 Tax=Methanoculleus sp. 10 TaxID=430615 RepID=UPI0025E10460|nr:hypothetical protein [Methanoculleus sp. 10]